jgi:hypothetical protein
VAAVRVLARAEWEAQLRQLKCWPYIGANPLRTAEDWETEHGFLFFVPMDNAEGRLRFDDLNTVLVQIAKLKPDIEDSGILVPHKQQGRPFHHGPPFWS